jgi:type I restriction enzyme S subunit
MAWANQKTIEHLQTLPEESLKAFATNPEWHAAEIIYHIVDSADHYAFRISGLPALTQPGDPCIDDVTEISDLARLKEQAAIVDKALLDCVRLEDIQIEYKNYEDKLVKRWRSTILSQAIHHATEHRAQLASALESHSERASRNLKRAAMRDLFTKGLRRDPQVETEFGLVPETWLSMALDDCAKVQTGVAKGRKFENAEMVDVPYLRVANVQDGHLDLSEMKLIHIRRSEVERYRLQTGDVVLTEGGDFDKLGRGFIWRGELDLCVHQNHVFAVRPDRKRLLPDFFAYLAQSAYGKAYFLKVAHKTTNLACINSTKLKAFPVLIPPTLEEQREIVEILDAIDQKISLHQQKRAVLEDLFKALLHKLMTGEIRVADLDLSALEAVEPEGAAA